MRQGLGFARPRPGNDQQRPITMRTGRSLRVVEGSFAASGRHSPDTTQMFSRRKIGISAII